MYASGEAIIKAYNGYQRWIDMQTGSFTSEAMILYNPETEQNELFVSIDPYNHEITFDICFDESEDATACAGCGRVDTDSGQCSVCCTSGGFAPGTEECDSCGSYEECYNHTMSL